jgi:hypothetical protein
LDSEGVDFCL